MQDHHDIFPTDLFTIWNIIIRVIWRDNVQGETHQLNDIFPFSEKLGGCGLCIVDWITERRFGVIVDSNFEFGIETLGVCIMFLLFLFKS